MEFLYLRDIILFFFNLPDKCSHFLSSQKEKLLCRNRLWGYTQVYATKRCSVDILFCFILLITATLDKVLHPFKATDFMLNYSVLCNCELEKYIYLPLWKTGREETEILHFQIRRPQHTTI